MKRQESTEDYLETILILTGSLGVVRSIDIVNEMGFSKPSVSIAMKNLREKGFVLMDDDGYITLTEQGRRMAEGVYERHRMLTKFLILLGVDEKTAAEDACRMEHDISEITFQKMKRHAEESRGGQGDTH